MLTITDPCELKPADIYRQASTVASKTSRGTDGHWYRAADELPCQWHLWFDSGKEVVSATYSRQDNVWRPGPPVPLVTLTTGEGVNSLMGELLSTLYFPQKPAALGVVLHLADEFALAEISQSGEISAEGGDDFQILRYNLVDDPREVLADREVSVEANAWRLLPFWGAQPGQQRCTAVTLSRSREEFLQRLMACGEAMRLPVRVAVTAAPVEALAALPQLQFRPAAGCLVAVLYLKHTAVFALNNDGELRSVRCLLHRGGLPTPSGFGDILWNMAVSAELAGPDGAAETPPRVLLVSAQPFVLQAAAQDLEVYSVSRRPLVHELLDLAQSPLLVGMPGHRPEFLIYDGASAIERDAEGLAGTTTFKELRTGWARQSFMNTARLDAIYPTRQDLRLLRFSTWFVWLLVFSLIGTTGYGAWSLFEAMNHPSWSLTPLQMKQTQDQHAKLLEEKRQIEVTSRLFQPRSRGWVTLEFLFQLFPEDSGVRLESFIYNVEASQPPAPVAKGARVESTGLVRTWTVRGLVKAKALELLSNLNSQRGLSAFFARVAEATGDASYAPDPARILTVTLTQGRNSRFNSQAAPADVAREPDLGFPFNFEATITQTITDKDTLALPLEKPF